MRWTESTETDQKRFPVFAALALAIGLLSGCVAQPTREAPPAPPPEPESSIEQRRPCPPLAANELETDAIELLDRGETDRARHLLDCAIEENPGSRRASLLIRQLEADPVSFLGARYYFYTVRPSETLSKIAQQRLGDDLRFVILARYNDIPVPANLVAGQRIKIPGTRPAETPKPPAVTSDEPVEPVPPPEPPVVNATDPHQAYEQALAQEQQGDHYSAYEALNELKARGAEIPGLDEDLARVRSALVAKLEDEAWKFELAGNIDQAVATWRRLLEIDPSNIPAQLSIRRLTQ